MSTQRQELAQLLTEISTCRLCAANLPLGPRPVLRASASARMLIIGQAPGTRVHASGIPWDDASGKRLREWMGIDEHVFYDASRIAIMPMGFCYPGRSKGGDLPPRPECAPLWHQQVLAKLPAVELVLLVGNYAQKHYLPETRQLSLSERVRQWQTLDERYMPLVHPSPRNTHWLQQNPWFEASLVPALQDRVQAILKP